ncbi:hypothetical protein CAEBREN_25893 [Caenorhabditis brenneri]|uniref:C2H2-type domain-containing protein n=1 Tax=Caenorhabditis brenneri TaxID=135651 RepID=G0PJ06_CAEBE|nr:hypothetical protein CAEBREN_25893 [Caenorhabditis brenneri]
MTSSLRCVDCTKSTVYPSEEELKAHIAAVHIKMFPYSCQLCKYGKLPTEYALANHYSEVHGNTNSFTMSVSYSNTLRSQRKELEKKLRASIDASNSPGSTTPRTESDINGYLNETTCSPVKCLDCTEEYLSKEKLEAHIADVHLNSLPYECETCKHTMFPTEHILRLHHHEDHKSYEFKILMQYSPEIAEERKELARRLEMCMASSQETTAPGIAPVDTEPNRSTDPAVSTVSRSTRAGLAVAHGNSNRVQPSRTVQGPLKRGATERSSGGPAKRVPVEPKISQVKNEAPAASPVDPDIKLEELESVKSEYPSSSIEMSQIKVEDSVGTSSSSMTVRDAGWPVPFPLKIEEPEEAEDSDQDHEEQVDQEEEEEDSEDEDEENVPDDSGKRKSCLGHNLTCSLCSMTLTCLGSKIPHACVHEQFTLFECKVCNRKFTGYPINDVQRHMKTMHNIKNKKDVQKNIKDHRKAMRAKILELRDKCFPKK